MIFKNEAYLNNIITRHSFKLLHTMLPIVEFKFHVTGPISQFKLDTILSNTAASF